MTCRVQEEPNTATEVSSGYGRVLVLNRNWQAVNIIGVKRTFSLMWQDHARAINTFEGDFVPMDAGEWLEYSGRATPGPGREFVRTIRMNILLPKVLLLNEFDRLPIAEVKFNRQNIFARDHYTCQYTGKRCKSSELTLDHVIPRERGGRTSWENLVTCRRDINSRKANKLPHEAGLQLLRKPKKPRGLPFVASIPKQYMDEAWRHFIPAEKNAS